MNEESDLVKNLRSEIAELKTGLGVAGEFIKRNDTLTRKLEICLAALDDAAVPSFIYDSVKASIAEVK